MNNNILTFCLIILSILNLFGCSDSPVESQKDKTLKLHSIVSGAGAKTVVFENGLGMPLETWDPIISNISAISKSFTYNRAGYFPSPEMNPVRSLENIVTELRTHLQLSGLSAPYILVGHSYGGLVMYYFAKKYPNEVEALILIDSTPHNLLSRMRSAGIPDSLFYPSQNELKAMPPLLRSEFESIISAEQEIDGFASLAQIPLRVLTSSLPIQGRPTEYTNLWVELHNEIAQESSLGEHFVFNNAGHHIHVEEPEKVVEIISEVINN